MNQKGECMLTFISVPGLSGGSVPQWLQSLDHSPVKVFLYRSDLASIYLASKSILEHFTSCTTYDVIRKKFNFRLFLMTYLCVK